MRNSLVVLAALVLWMGRADAGGRKRLVVLDFEGPKAEKFHADVVKLFKKGHTVLTVDKWNEKAEEMDATAVTDKNIKKLAKKLKIDGVITGKIEKRRDEYILRLKLRSGTTGEIVGNPVQTKADGPGLDAQAKRDIKDELLPAVDELESTRGGGDEGDEEEESPKKKGDEAEEEEGSGKKSGFSRKGKMKEEEAEEEESPKLTKKQKAEEEKKAKAEEEKRKKAEEEEAKRLAKEEEAKKKKEDEQRKKDEAKKKKDEQVEAAALATKKDKDKEEDEEEESSSKRAKGDEEEDEEGGRKAKKRKASADEEEEEGIEDKADRETGRDLSPAGRALDAVVGMSFTARTLKFNYQADLGKPPPGYKQSIPVAGAMLDVTFYPLAFGKTQGIIRGIGLNVMYDQVLVINSQKRYSDQQGMQQIANLDTKENRWAVGPVLRYPLGKIVVGGSLTYGKQQFTVKQTLPNNEPTDIPNVTYTMITPAAFLKYPITPKITANADLAFHAITNTGQIQSTGMAGYGAATVTGYELEAGGDYMVTKNIFARVSVRYEAIGFKFKGDPTSQTNIRDTDPEQDVSGAKDTYLGGTATVGYVY